MKKLILITIILLLQSFPSYSNEFEGKGLICFYENDNEKKNIVGIFFLKNNYYFRYELKNFEFYTDLSEFDEIPSYSSKEHNVKYKVTDEFIITHIDKINRYTSENIVKDKKIHNICHLQKSSGLTSQRKDALIANVFAFLDRYKERYEEKLKLRNF